MNFDQKRQDYYQRWTELLSIQGALDSNNFSKYRNKTFEELIVKGRALNGLHLTSVSLAISSSQKVKEYEKVCELTFSMPAKVEIANTQFSEGTKAYVFYNRSTLDCFNTEKSNQIGIITVLSSDLLIMEAAVEKNFDINDFKDLTAMIVCGEDSSHLYEQENLNHVFKDLFGNQEIVDLVVTLDDSKEKLKNMVKPATNEQIIQQAINAKGFFLIHGPPGTGKTRTCAEIILRILENDRDKKILVCCHSNKAVDTLLTKVDFLLSNQSDTTLKAEESILRVGRLYKVVPVLRKYTLYEKI